MCVGGGVFGVPAGKNEPELAARDAAVETELGAAVAAVAAGPRDREWRCSAACRPEAGGNCCQCPGR